MASKPLQHLMQAAGSQATVSELPQRVRHDHSGGCWRNRLSVNSVSQKFASYLTCRGWATAQSSSSAGSALPGGLDENSNIGSAVRAIYALCRSASAMCKT